MLVNVETFLLYSLVNTYTYTLIYYLEDNIGNYYAVDDAYHGGYNLNPKLMPVAIEGTLYAFGSCYILSGEDTGEDRTQDTAHTMHTKGIEGIIILELLLYYRYHEEADDGGNDTDAESSENIGTAGCWSDGYQSGNSTGTSTYRSWLLVYNPVDEHPGGSCCSCGDMGYKEGIGCHDEYRLHQDAENILLAHQTTIIMC